MAKVSKTISFSTLQEVLTTPPPVADNYTFLKHTEAPYLYARVSKTGLRTWHAHYKDKDGKSQKESLGNVDDISLFEAAAEAANRARAASKAAVKEGPSAMTVKTACELFLERLDSPASDLADGTKDKYRNSINRYLLPLGDKALEDLKEPHWRQFKDGLLLGKSSLSEAPLAIATVQGIFSAVTQLYKLAHDHRGIRGEDRGWDPGRIVMAESPPANRKKGHIKLENIGRAWLASDALCSPGWRDMFRLFLLTGLRESLLRELMWKNVDFNAGSLLFDPLAKGTKRQRRALAHDERKVPIEIPLSEYALNILRRRKLFAPPNNPYVFYATSGTKTRGSVQNLGRSDKAFANIANAIGQHFTRHDLRRTFASLGCTGAPDKIGHVALLLMHTNKLIAETINVPEITLQYAQQQTKGMRRVTEIVTTMVLELAGELPKTSLTGDIPTLVLDNGIAQTLKREEIAYVRQSRTSNLDDVEDIEFEE